MLSIERTHPCARLQVINLVERLIVVVLRDIVTNQNATFHRLKLLTWPHFQAVTAETQNDSCNYIVMKNIYVHSRSRQKFSIILFVLENIHCSLLINRITSSRELYYKDKLLIQNQVNVKDAIHDVCTMLQISPWKLGIQSSGKGLVAGSLRIFLTNGDIIDCRSYLGATLLPEDLTVIDHMESDALFVLVVEKDTVFRQLLGQNICDALGVKIVLITGKGFPDFSTRFFVHRLYVECRLPIFLLVDADPFGIEILLIYRFGSRAVAEYSDDLACPEIRWMGIHPSEISLINVKSVPLNERDRTKLSQQLNRRYLEDAVRREILVLKHMQRKVNLEGVLHSSSFYFFVNDYIPNKIKRQLYL